MSIQVKVEDTFMYTGGVISASVVLGQMGLRGGWGCELPTTALRFVLYTAAVF